MRMFLNYGKNFVMFTLRGTSLSMIEIYFLGVSYSFRSSEYLKLVIFFMSAVLDKSYQTFFLTEKWIPFNIEK